MAGQGSEERKGGGGGEGGICESEHHHQKGEAEGSEGVRGIGGNGRWFVWLAFSFHGIFRENYFAIVLSLFSHVIVDSFDLSHKLFFQCEGEEVLLCYHGQRGLLRRQRHRYLFH